MEIPVSGPLERIASRAQRAFRALGKVETFDEDAGMIGTIRSGRDTARLSIHWRARDEGFLLDIESRSDDSRAADSAIYAFASEYKGVILAEREAFDNPEPPFSLGRWVRSIFNRED